MVSPGGSFAQLFLPQGFDFRNFPLHDVFVHSSLHVISKLLSITWQLWMTESPARRGLPYDWLAPESGKICRQFDESLYGCTFRSTEGGETARGHVLQR